ncbi:MAG TPA: AbrB/MazE/SpoVT family DNA-binding domain-containing protein [Atribacterota bacterium]|nr:AbrB/MazE/SpoVT family DNA-binding domain-containing protein [Atribacterota bacterium]
MNKMAKIRDNSQITIPKNIMEKLDLKKGDTVSIELRDDEIILKPVVIIDKSQAWFWTEKWQKEEREAESDIKAGRIKSFHSADELMKDLKNK